MPGNNVTDEMVKKAYLAIAAHMNERGPFATSGLARAALTAGLAAMWRPISDHDGNSDDVLVSWDGFVAEAYYNAETGSWWQANTSEHDFDAANPIWPTCWQPLPAPPTPAKEVG